MKRSLLLVMALTAANVFAQDIVSPEAFAQPLPSLSNTEREQFFRGRTLVRQSWVVAPSKDELVDGLGPLYNRLACASCHPHNGRGQPPATADERMLSMLVRLSVPGHDSHGGPKPHPAYGGQLNEEGIPGVAGEGRAYLTWREVKTVTLAGGEKVSLRQPQVHFAELAYGPIKGVLTSPRVGQQMVGMGLLDAVPASTLEALAKEPKPDGIKGRANHVWNPETQRMEVGRFGYKSNMPTLRAQSAGAFNGDLGITSPLFPGENCMPVQTACKKAPTGGSPELSAGQLDDVEFYLAHLELPARHRADDPAVKRGEAKFAEIGCAACHRPELVTDPKARSPHLAGQTIQPYTDLLVHDMGEGLSDHRPDYQAGGRDWRTAPLWGLGATAAVSEATFFLHDGRARTLPEAILWHAGEARPARERFTRLSQEERAALVDFLKSL
ncbi:di-heme oxidoredictase family protein [Rhodoferax sp.]|uniref:di-heme oxidoreductase family protein n=1 Tax=Rhodoferax sp. TaxID=50421 RepID=UPI002846A68B|nr:di-heme oxidoredictase family protein [Rhodoferax sp.]MDR3369344.1 di-heme oxidoredictase family protein [Rhodoferax sp.]